MNAAKKPTLKKKRKLTIKDRDELPEALHVALRKGCDSHPTTLLWNLIYKLTGRIWPIYLDHVWATLQTEATTPTNNEWWEVLRKASRSFGTELYRNGKPTFFVIDHHGFQMIEVLFMMFDDDDWRGYASYLDYQ